MNYKHLYYFLQVAKLGSVMRASERLHLTPQTISGQIQLLEEALGGALFAKSGRGLVLTETGRLALGYAEEIFSIGAELQAAVREQPGRGPVLEFRVGVADAVPKSIAYWLVEPATQLPEPVRIVCREWKLDSLLAELALHRLDLVISDTPIPPSVSVLAFNHRLGASGVSFFAAPSVLEGCTGTFPQCLNGAPMLMPSRDSAVGQRLQSWLQVRSLHPRVVAEFDDSALAKEFGRRGAGVFVGPTVLAKEVEKELRVQTLGAATDLVDEFFAISVERRITHPCVIAITQSARKDLFALAGKAPRTRSAASRVVPAKARPSRRRAPS
ncbi:MAG: transcriptional activator NhaR [Ramlibacter sp.]